MSCSLKQEGDIVTIHTFDTLQLNTYLGHREENSITHLTKYMKEPVETSCRLSSYHKVFLSSCVTTASEADVPKMPRGVLAAYVRAGRGSEV